jgi:CRISPR-associated protein (TIGR03986 family)
MPENNHSYNNNPYNFVSLNTGVFVRYSSLKDLPHQGQIQADLLSGTIQMTITAETPLSVSDGKDGFFRNAGGQYVIPGSTIKGMVRSNMQILGFGALRPGEDFNDVHLLYRAIASKKDSPKHSPEKCYSDTLGIKPTSETNPETGKKVSYSVASKVSAGYLVQYDFDKKYVIYPTEYFKINRAQDIAKRWENSYTKTEKVWYQVSKNRVVTVLEPRTAPQPEKTSPGILLCTGRAVGKANHLYLFPAFNKDKEPSSLLPLSDKAVMTYLSDFEMRKNSLKGTNQKAKMDVSYWKLPMLAGNEKQTEPWPVFYLNDGKRIDYFGRSPFFRVGYKYSLGQGVPQKHKKAANELTLDYPYSILGFSWNHPTDKKEDFSYKSRVSFGDCVSNTAPEKEKIPMILGEPKPSSFADYSVEGKDYNQEDFRIRGIKQYWLKEEQHPTIEKNKEKVTTNLTVVPAGTVFQSSIRFHNLKEDELGLLLWCLKLDKDCYQTIGKGKPYGYGRAKVQITSVERDCPEALYSAASLLPETNLSSPLDVDELIEQYQQSEGVQKFLRGQRPDQQDSVKDLMYIHRVIRDANDVRYITLNEYRFRASSEILPTIEKIRTDADEAEEKRAAEEKKTEKIENGSMDDWKQMLAQRFNASHSANTKTSSKKKKKR